MDASNQKLANDKKLKRVFQGAVILDKMDKTIVVEVERTKRHPLYKKTMRVSKRFKVHDEKNEYKIGDKIVFAECRPISKDKRWRVIKKV